MDAVEKVATTSHDDLMTVIIVCVAVLLLVCCKYVSVLLRDVTTGVDVCMSSCFAVDACCYDRCAVGSVRIFVFFATIMQPVLVALTPLMVHTAYGDGRSLQSVCLFDISFNATTLSAMRAHDLGTGALDVSTQGLVRDVVTDSVTQMHGAKNVYVTVQCSSSTMFMLLFAVTSAVAVSLWWNVNQHISDDPVWDDDICSEKGVMAYELLYVVEVFGRNLAFFAISALPVQLHTVLFMAACTTFIMMYFFVTARSEVHYDNVANGIIVIVMMCLFVNILVFHATYLVDIDDTVALAVASAGTLVSLADVLFHFMCAGGCYTSVVIMTRCVLSCILTYTYVIAEVASKS